MSPDQLIEFTVPFDLENCRQRLENRHERPTFFAWDWQRRTHVRTRQTAPDTVEFTLKRLEKNDWFSWGSMALVSGAMRGLGNQQTVVVARTRIVYFWLIAPVVLFVLGGVAAGFSIANDPATNINETMLMIGFFGVAAVGSTIFSWWWAHAQLRHLIGTLKEALGQWA